MGNALTRMRVFIVLPIEIEAIIPRPPAAGEPNLNFVSAARDPSFQQARTMFLPLLGERAGVRANETTEIP
jgi:hypothetical protein